MHSRQTGLFLLGMIILFTSCNPTGNESSQTVQTRGYQAKFVTLTEEDVSLLQSNHPDILKKIHLTTPISINDIIFLQQLGFTSDVMIAIIIHTKSRFELTTRDVLKLQAEGVPFRVINYMIRS